MGPGPGFKTCTGLKKKILFIMQLPPPVHGASVVNKNIRDSAFLNETFDCTFVNLTTARDVSDIGTGGLRKVLAATGIWREVLQHYAKNRFDLVYLTLSPHGPAFFKDGLLAILLKRSGARLVYHLHGKGIKEIAAKSRFKRRLYQWVFRDVKVIHLAKGLYQDIREFVRKEDVWIVPNGIPGHGSTGARDNTPGRILYLSNMQETKGSMVLLKAGKILKERQVGYKMDFVGKWHSDPGFKKAWEDYQKKNNLQDISYHGAQYGKDKEFFLESADIFVLPTFYQNECFPIAILEAMSYALPVVSTDEGAISEIVIDGKTGYIVPRNSPEALADALEKLLSDKPKALQMGQAGLEAFETKYTLPVFEKNLANALKEIISRYESTKEGKQ
jgi:glycosyltransferase involved in cell wall biosynthesis